MHTFLPVYFSRNLKAIPLGKICRSFLPWVTGLSSEQLESDRDESLLEE